MFLKDNTPLSEYFTVFPCGWWDETEQRAKPQQRPQQNQTIGWAYEYITSERARKATEELRALISTATEQQQRDFKILNFEYATFTGTYSYRNARSLKTRSPFMVIDIDHLGSTAEARQLQQHFVCDTTLETALCFLSPRGEGVKWVIRLPSWTDGLPFKQQFESVRRYVGFNYGVDPDESGSDLPRACFLPWDSQCYVNSKYLF